MSAIPSTSLESRPAQLQRSGRLPLALGGWLLLWLLFAFQLQFSMEAGASVLLSLAVMLPLATAWGVVRFGPGLIAPIALGALMPSLNFNLLGTLSISVRPMSSSLLLLGMVCGAWFASLKQPGLWQGLVHHARLWLLLPAFCLLFLVRFEVPVESVNVAGFRFSYDLFGALAAGLLVLVVDWTWLARRTQELMRTQAAWVLVVMGKLLPLGLVLSFALRPFVRVGSFGLGWGTGWAEATAVVLALALGLTRALPWRRCLWVLALMLAVEALRFGIGGRPLGMLFGAGNRAGMPAEMMAILCHVSSAVLLGLVLRSVAMDATAVTTRRTTLALLAIVALQFFVAPAIDHSWGYGFYLLGAGGWLIGGVAFTLALARGGRGLALAPLLLAMTAIIGPMALGDASSPLPFLTRALEVSGLAALYAFCGWLVSRRMASARDTAKPRDEVLDIGRAARFVHRLDVSATLRSFGALLAVAGGVWFLVLSSSFVVLMQGWQDFGRADGLELLMALGLVLLVAALPLVFIVSDSMNRQDRLRPLSALSGAALAALGAAVGAVLLTMLTIAPSVLLDASEEGAIRMASGLAGGLSVVLATALVARSRVATVASSALTAVLVVAGGLAMLKLSLQDESDSMSLAAQVALLIAAAVVLVLLLRGVRLRADLASDVPRGLLFGEIGGGRSFWARLACLMGMPSSTWRAAAMRRPEFWALLLARPLVYVGSAAVWKGQFALGGLAIVAGHALFAGGKWLASRVIWRVGGNDGPAPVLFLRSFENDQFHFGSRPGRLLRQWLELWSFRRNLDEALVDEVARYGPVVALGRPGETRTPFGAARHYSTHDDWQRVITDTARHAHTIVIAAGDTPGVLWEYALLAREGMLHKTVLLFRPGRDAQAANRAALQAFPIDAVQGVGMEDLEGKALVALLHLQGKPFLLTADRAEPASYVLALRVHFQQRQPREVAEAARAAPAPWFGSAGF